MAEDITGPQTLTLAGKVALVTGGTKGIGRAIAETLLAAGASVVVCARNEPDTLPEAGGRQATFISGDVRQALECARIVDEAVALNGRLDILVNNAGGSPHVEAATASPRFSEAIVALNLLAPIHMSQAAYKSMSDQPEGGCIVNIASVSAVRPSPGTAVYGAAKAGLLGLTKSLAQEWGPSVRVNVIVVGLMETEDGARTYGSSDAMREIAAATPMKRMGLGADVAGAVLYLSSPMAGWVSGATLEVHGGGERPHFLDIIQRNMPETEADS
ncbi:MAG: SDR family oxidoreductase [Rhizobiaceae bacterium]|nr:SDR family oxidoreductase [Rhizobiaceae bacterium]